MTVLLLYLLALISLLVGTSAVYMALIEAFPIRWLYYRRLFGKPIVWTIFVGSIAWSLWRRYSSEVVYLKEQLMNHGIVHNEALHFYLVAADNTVNAFSDSLAGTPLELSLGSNQTLADAITGTVWDIRGKRLNGALEADLEPIALSDEYWFSWRRFHPRSELVRV